MNINEEFDDFQKELEIRETNKRLHVPVEIPDEFIETIDWLDDMFNLGIDEIKFS